MSYTPTTEEGFISRYTHPTLGKVIAISENYFPQFLSEVKAQAWEEGEADGEWNFQNQFRIALGEIEGIANPYRKGEEHV